MRSVDSIRQANRIGCVSQCDVDIEWGKGEKKLTIVFISRPRLDTVELIDRKCLTKVYVFLLKG